MGYKADSIFKNQFFNMLMQALNIAFPLIAIPYTTRLFGPEVLGEINFANSIVQYFLMISTAGIPIYAVREIAKARDDKELLNKKFKEIAILQAIFAIVSTILYVILIFNMPRFRAEIYIYLFLGIQIISNIFNYVWFIQGIEKYRYVAITTFITKVINIVLIFTLLKSREDYNLYAFIMGITVFINVFLNMIISIRLFKDLKYDQKININYKNLKLHMKFIFIFFLSDVAVKVYTAMDQTMLGIIDSNEAVGYYSMSIRLVKTLLTFVTSLSVVLLPRISNSIINNKSSDVKKYLSISIKLVYLIAIPAIFGILAIGEEIINIYLGSEFLQSASVFKLVSILLLIIGLSNVFGVQVMIPYGKEKKFTTILIYAAISNFIINLLLIPEFSYIGAAFATILAELLVTVLMYFEVKKILGSVPEVFNVTKFIVPSLVFYIIIKLIIKNIITSDLYVIIFSIPLAAVIYAGGLIALKEDIVITSLDKLKDLLLKLRNKK
ncbi:Putative O-antigen transporter [uncultured Clostridium sp.]|nr:Putative O-antigen transporter [uncultured Clostridium sp.]SCJ15648.1 Putative O-antigen transporter [uncultured Clostridium sp.]